MDEVTRGMAEATLALEAVLLQAFVHRGVLSHHDALQAIDICLDAAVAHTRGNSEAEVVAAVSRSCLADIRECVLALVTKLSAEQRPLPPASTVPPG
jgi:hypothetical protein